MYCTSQSSLVLAAWLEGCSTVWVFWPEEGEVLEPVLEEEADEEAEAAEPEEDEVAAGAGAAEPPLTTTSALEPSAVPQVVPPGMSEGPTV